MVDQLEARLDLLDLLPARACINMLRDFRRRRWAPSYEALARSLLRLGSRALLAFRPPAVLCCQWAAWSPWSLAAVRDVDEERDGSLPLFLRLHLLALQAYLEVLLLLRLRLWFR